MFLDNRSDLQDLYARMSILVHPSLSEGLPNVILEGMACGVPVIATAVGGCPEVVVDGVTGILVRPNDCQALGRAISELLVSTRRRRTMAAAARDHVAVRFSAAAMVCAHETLYVTLLRDKRVMP